MFARILPLVILFLVAAPSRAASGLAAALAPVDPRSLGMGGASLALSGGPLAMRLNPACVSSLESSEIAISHLSWLGDTFQDQLAYSAALSEGKVLSTGLGYFSVPAFDSTGGREPAFSAGLARVDLGYAQQSQGRLGTLAMGGSASYLDQRLGSLELRHLAISLGLSWQTPLPLLRLGAVAKNLAIYSNSGNSLPMELGLGLGARGKILAAAVDCIAAEDGSAQLRLGGEWNPHPMLAIRLGFSNADSPGAVWALSTGLGLQWTRWTADFAWQGRGALGSAMLVSLSARWGASSGGSSVAPAQSVKVPVPVPVPVEVQETPEVAKPARLSSVKAPDWWAGNFELEAVTDGQIVRLSWPDQSAELPKMTGYEVLMGMVLEAPLQKTGQGIVKEPHWSEEMAVRGMTYYFQVKILDQGGEVLRVSRIKAVQMP